MQYILMKSCKDVRVSNADLDMLLSKIDADENFNDCIGVFTSIEKIFSFLCSMNLGKEYLKLTIVSTYDRSKTYIADDSFYISTKLSSTSIIPRDNEYTIYSKYKVIVAAQF